MFIQNDHLQWGNLGRIIEGSNRPHPQHFYIQPNGLSVQREVAYLIIVHSHCNCNSKHNQIQTIQIEYKWSDETKQETPSYIDRVPQVWNQKIRGKKWIQIHLWVTVGPYSVISEANIFLISTTTPSCNSMEHSNHLFRKLWTKDMVYQFRNSKMDRLKSQTQNVILKPIFTPHTHAQSPGKKKDQNLLTMTTPHPKPPHPHTENNDNPTIPLISNIPWQ